MSEERYSDGDLVCTQGSPVDSMLIVAHGAVAMKGALDGVSSTTSADLSAPLGVGKCLGQEAVIDRSSTKDAVPEVQKWPTDVVAVGASVSVLRLQADEVHDLLGDLGALKLENFQLDVLRSIELLGVLTKGELAVLVEAMSEVCYKAGKVILRQGEPGDTFYIVRSGEVHVLVKGEVKGAKERMVKQLGVGSYFGEIALLRDEPRTATVVAVTAVVCMAVDRETFHRVLGPMQSLVEREASRRRDESARHAQRPAGKRGDFTTLAVLGVGAFGHVLLVEHGKTTSCYALKCMRKRQILALQQVTHVNNERTLLASCQHPFVINLVTTFQDTAHIYMLLEFAPGGDLYKLLRGRGKFEEDMARFYAASVLLALSYLHERQIVYRDVKPENLMLDDRGYVKLVDFGFAKQLDDRTFTLCGTPEYLAPEIISNVGHELAVDWWAVGILLYEMLSGAPPFEDGDQMALYRSILRGQVAYPATIFADSARDLISRLLVRTPTFRLGSLRRGTRDVSDHSFFKPINYATLMNGTACPPHVPILTSPKDIACFDTLHEMDTRPPEPSWAYPVPSETDHLFKEF